MCLGQRKFAPASIALMKHARKLEPLFAQERLFGFRCSTKNRTRMSEYVGAGAGNEEDPIAEISLTNYLKQQAQSPTQPTQSREQLILAAAKQGLALSLGVSEDDILITIRTPRSDF